MMERHLARVLLGLLPLLAACDDGPLADQRTEHQLAFVRIVDGKNDMYRVNDDGSGTENITKFPALYYTPAPSPDGKKLAFYSNRGDCLTIWTMKSDGSEQMPLTTYADARCARGPRWSPDGRRIAYSATIEGDWAVWVMNADGGGNKVKVSRSLTATGQNVPSGWTPDGRVVFHNVPSDVWATRAYVVNADGSGLQPLLPAGDIAPDWSPDGSKVAFLRDVGGRYALHVMNANGSGVRRLTDHASDDRLRYVSIGELDFSPWSKDGAWIAFSTEFRTAEGLVPTGVDVIRPDGTGYRRLVAPALGTWLHGWSPDGRVTYTASVAGRSDVYVVRPDSTGLLNMTGGIGSNGPAVWVRR